jgi:tetratricopeptide (TPR) repeat protein
VQLDELLFEARRAALRAGLFLAGDPAVALREAARLPANEQQLAELFQFIASEEYAQLREELGLAPAGVRPSRIGAIEMSRENDTDPGQQVLTDELERLAAQGEQDQPAEPVDRELAGELSAISTRLGFGEALRARSESAVDPSEVTHRTEASWNDLVELLLAEIESATSPRQAAVLLYELGHLYEMRLRQPDRALDAYRRSHERFPGLAVNARALSRLLAQAGDASAAERVLSAELSGASNASERVAVRLERAQLLADQLGEVDRACDELHKALESIPMTAS